MAGDDRFALTLGDGTKDLVNGFVGGHDKPSWNGLLGIGVEGTLVVDAANIGSHETGADESDFNARKSEFGGDGVGERAHREFAHGVRRSAGSGTPARDAADQDDIALRIFDGGKSRVDSAKQAEDVGFKLAAIIVEGEFLEGADDTETGVGDDDVETVIGAKGFVYGARKIGVICDVGGNDEGRGLGGGRDFLGEGVEQFPSARGEGQASIQLRELESEFFADAGGGAGDEDGFVLEEGMESRHWGYGSRNDAVASG